MYVCVGSRKFHDFLTMTMMRGRISLKNYQPFLIDEEMFYGDCKQFSVFPSHTHTRIFSDDLST